MEPKLTWYQRNRDKVRAQSLAWRAANPDRYKEIQRNAKRKARKSRLTTNDINCPQCGQPLPTEQPIERGMFGRIVHVEGPPDGWNGEDVDGPLEDWKRRKGLA